MQRSGIAFRDSHLSSRGIAAPVERATKFALAPKRVYHDSMSPWVETCGSIDHLILNLTSLFTFLPNIAPKERRGIVLSLWHFP